MLENFGFKFIDFVVVLRGVSGRREEGLGRRSYKEAGGWGF